MKARPFEELKWDVPTPDLLRELSTSSLPLRLRSSETHRSFYRDLYFDTADGSLSRRGIVCRWRVGADDRRTLSVSFPGSPLVASEIPETDPVAAFAGGSEAARRLRGGADPAALQVLTELEVERLTRDARSPWPWGGRFALMYDAVSVRRSGIVRGFQELKLRRVDPGVPSLERIGEAIGTAPGLRTMIETKLARAQRLTANLEREALARAIASGRTTVLLAIDSGKVALRQTSHGLRLPAGEGQGESACRHLLQETLGSGVGDLSFLGTVPGVGTIRLLDIWVARRIRLDRAMLNDVVWIPLGRARRDRRRPRARGCRDARRDRVRAPLRRCSGARGNGPRVNSALQRLRRPTSAILRYSIPISAWWSSTRGCLRSPKISARRCSSDSVSSPSSAPISMSFSW